MALNQEASDTKFAEEDAPEGMTAEGPNETKERKRRTTKFAEEDAPEGMTAEGPNETKERKRRTIRIHCKLG
ncbi:hypothetical protein QE152_g26219 [Popillia japonica]|uniref:Uncharacterized protein n=1 Tax=Popillia japonica TaxID=7064 RepID=A0AAW1JXG8_POPJA